LRWRLLSSLDQRFTWHHDHVHLNQADKYSSSDVHYQYLFGSHVDVLR